jgi:hypothetical protein
VKTKNAPFFMNFLNINKKWQHFFGANWVSQKNRTFAFFGEKLKIFFKNRMKIPLIGDF